MPEKTAVIDFLFLAGAWVRGDDTAEGYAWAYNAQQPSTSTYNPRRNWCLPAQLFEESGTSTSMCFAPSVAFAAEMFPDPKAASSGLSLAAAPAAAAAASSGLLQPSRSSALLNLPTLLMDVHGNVFEEVGVDDRGAKIIMPTADGDLSWVAVYVLKNHADLWRCRVSATDPTRVDFEFVITETRYADLLAAIRVPDIVSFDDSDSSPLDALKRDGIITGPFRAESAEEEEGGGGDDGAVVERYYHEGQRKELDNAEEEWLLPADDAEALPPPMPEE